MHDSAAKAWGQKEMDAVGIEPTTTHMLKMRSEYHTPERLLVECCVLPLRDLCLT